MVDGEKIHYHDGPWAGKSAQISARDLAQTNVIKVEGMHSGAYVKDERSAGGRCFDWRES